jgi:uncharacterized membrane protein YhhN
MPATALALFASALAAALAYLTMLRAPVSLSRSVVKTAPASLAALGAALLGLPALLSLALAASAIGDLSLSRPGRRAFVAGLSAFALAHAAYVVLMLRSPGGMTPTALPGVLLVVALAISTEVWLRPHAAGLAWPVRAYVVLISAMALSALWAAQALPLARWGAAAFLASDMMLAIGVFRMAGQPPLALSAAVWLSYVAAQALLVAAWALPFAGFTH